MGVWLNMGREHWSRSIPERHATQHMVALRLRLLLLISLFIHNITYQPQNIYSIYSIYTNKMLEKVKKQLQKIWTQWFYVLED